MKVVFDPSTNKFNKYIDIIVSGLRENGLEVFSIKNIFADWKKFKSVRIVHLNWYENIDTNLDFIKKGIKLLILQLSNKTIIWTMHNKVQHDIKKSFLGKLLFRWLVLTSKKIVIHCRQSINFLDLDDKQLKKVIYIPHPNYISAYEPNIDVGEDSLEDDKKLKVLFVGSVKPYKNIELLMKVIESFPNDVELLIAGKPFTSEYADILYLFGSAITNIKFDLNFIDDAKLLKYIKNCHLLILPYDIASSLNSGTVILAFSNRKTVIAPNIGTIQDFNYPSRVLSYEYQNQEEHEDNLKAMVSKAISLKRNNSNVFVEYGNDVYDRLLISNNNSTVISNYLELYANLDHKY